jgi:hypothetical protein
MHAGWDCKEEIPVVDKNWTVQFLMLQTVSHAVRVP